MRRFIKTAVVTALAVAVLAGGAFAAVNDVWFGSSTTSAPGTVDVYMSTDGAWFGLNLAFAYGSGISSFTYTADAAFLTAIGGTASVAVNAVSTLADGSNGYSWETYALVPDKAQWNGKVGTISVDGNAGAQVSLFTADGQWNGATAVFDSTNYGKWVGASLNDAASIKTVQIVPEPGSLLALGMGAMGLAGFAIRRRK